MKTCTRCQQLKSFEAFSKNVKRKDGYSYWCRACEKQYNDERRNKKFSPVSDDTPLTCSTCKETKLAKEFSRNRAMLNGRMNICKSCDDAKYRANHRVNLARRRKHRLNNLEHEKAYNKRYQRNNRARMNGYAAKRRAMKIGIVVEGSVTEQEWQELLTQYDNRCAYCATQLVKTVKNANTGKDATQDHIIPLTRGGHHIIENLLPACRSCNSTKHDKTFEEYTQWLLEDAPKELAS